MRAGGARRQDAAREAGRLLRPLPEAVSIRRGTSERTWLCYRPEAHALSAGTPLTAILPAPQPARTPCSLQSALNTPSLWSRPGIPACDEGVISPVFQIRKLRPREITELGLRLASSASGSQASAAPGNPGPRADAPNDRGRVQGRLLQGKMGPDVLWKHPPPQRTRVLFFFLEAVGRLGCGHRGARTVLRRLQLGIRCFYPAVQVPSPARLATPQTAGRTSLH